MSKGKGLRAPRLIPPARGERVKSSKLLEEDVRGIRMMHGDGYSLGYIGKCYTAYKGFKISKQQIHRIVQREHWDHVKDRFRFVDVPDGSVAPGNSIPENKSAEMAI